MMFIALYFRYIIPLWRDRRGQGGGGEAITIILL
jgi:hypothetical protein